MPIHQNIRLLFFGTMIGIVTQEFTDIPIHIYYGMGRQSTDLVNILQRNTNPSLPFVDDQKQRKEER